MIFESSLWIFGDFQHFAEKFRGWDRDLEMVGAIVGAIRAGVRT